MYYDTPSGEMLSCPNVLTRITDAQIKELSKEEFNFYTLDSFLTERGLSVSNVYYAPNNRFIRVFYMDLEVGAHAILNLSAMRSESEEESLRFLEEYSRKGNPNLINQDWDAYYRLETDYFFTTADVPPPLQIYDFNWRYNQFPEDKLFYIWLRIHVHVTSSNGMWAPEALAKVFSLAPPVEMNSLCGEDVLTIYRGMVEHSQSIESALSWSSNPVSAMNFANHNGRGVCFAVGEVKISDIVAYREGNYNENEVIIRPGTVRNVRTEDMIPVSEGTIVGLLSPFLLEYIARCREVLKLGYKAPAPELRPGDLPDFLQSLYLPLAAMTKADNVHDVTHILRVLLLTMIYYTHSGERLSRGDCDILIYFSMLHDIGRTNDGEDELHGAASVEIIRRKGIRIRNISLSKHEYKIAHFIIEYHSLPDNIGDAALKQKAWNKKEKERAWHLYQICKDMDGLDRVRILNLDYRMLRTPFARKLPLVAGCLLKEDILRFLEE